MKITYKILWVEDQEDWLESRQEEIGEYLDEHGFVVDIKISNHGKLEEDIDYNIFDVVAVDYNLDNGKTGDDFIGEFRERALYTDILFYSADGATELRKKIADQGCDGVYCSSRHDAIDKLKNLIFTTIKKTQDVNNVRGLIIAETIDIEIKLKELALKIHQNTNGDAEKKKLEEIIGTYESYINKQIDKMKKLGLIKLLEEKCTHHNHVCEILGRLKVDQETHREKIEKLNKINSDIIELRNIMAHIKEEGGVLINSNNGRREVIDAEKCIEYRKLILGHHNNLEEIYLIIGDE